MIPEHHHTHCISNSSSGHSYKELFSDRINNLDDVTIDSLIANKNISQFDNKILEHINKNQKLKKNSIRINAFKTAKPKDRNNFFSIGELLQIEVSPKVNQIKERNNTLQVTTQNVQFEYQSDSNFSIGDKIKNSLMTLSREAEIFYQTTDKKLEDGKRDKNDLIIQKIFGGIINKVFYIFTSNECVNNDNKENGEQKELIVEEKEEEINQKDEKKNEDDEQKIKKNENLNEDKQEENINSKEVKENDNKETIGEKIEEKPKEESNKENELIDKNKENLPKTENEENNNVLEKIDEKEDQLNNQNEIKKGEESQQEIPFDNKEEKPEVNEARNENSKNEKIENNQNENNENNESKKEKQLILFEDLIKLDPTKPNEEGTNEPNLNNEEKYEDDIPSSNEINPENINSTNENKNFLTHNNESIEHSIDSRFLNQSNTNSIDEKDHQIQQVEEFIIKGDEEEIKSISNKKQFSDNNQISEINNEEKDKNFVSDNNIIELNDKEKEENKEVKNNENEQNNKEEQIDNKKEIENEEQKDEKQISNENINEEKKEDEKKDAEDRNDDFNENLQNELKEQPEEKKKKEEDNGQNKEIIENPEIKDKVDEGVETDNQLLIVENAGNEKKDDINQVAKIEEKQNDDLNKKNENNPINKENNPELKEEERKILENGEINYEIINSEKAIQAEMIEAINKSNKSIQVSLIKETVQPKDKSLSKSHKKKKGKIYINSIDKNQIDKEDTNGNNKNLPNQIFTQDIKNEIEKLEDDNSDEDNSLKILLNESLSSKKQKFSKSQLLASHILLDKKIKIHHSTLTSRLNSTNSRNLQQLSSVNNSKSKQLKNIEEQPNEQAQKETSQEFSTNTNKMTAEKKIIQKVLKNTNSLQPTPPTLPPSDQESAFLSPYRLSSKRKYQKHHGLIENCSICQAKLKQQQDLNVNNHCSSAKNINYIPSCHKNVKKEKQSQNKELKSFFQLENGSLMKMKKSSSSSNMLPTGISKKQFNTKMNYYKNLMKEKTNPYSSYWTEKLIGNSSTKKGRLMLSGKATSIGRRTYGSGEWKLAYDFSTNDNSGLMRYEYAQYPAIYKYFHY